jgi:hypothetical protein
MKDVMIDAYVPESVKRDVRRQIAVFRDQGAKVRLIRIGYEDFKRTINMVMATQRHAFRPTLCGIPVEWGTLDVVQVVAVRPQSPVLVADQAGRQRELEV